MQKSINFYLRNACKNRIKHIHAVTYTYFTQTSV